MRAGADSGNFGDDSFMSMSRISSLEIARHLEQHDLVYEAAPCEWHEGLPLGNGSLGALIWGNGGPFKITLDLNELWDLRTPRFRDKRYSYARFRQLYREGRIAEIGDIFDFRRRSIVPTRLPPLRLELNFGPRVRDYHARLRLGAATAEGTIGLEHGRIHWRAYVAASQDVLVVEVRSRNPLRAKPCIRLDHLSDAAKEALRRRGFPPPEPGRTHLYQEIPGNGGYLVAWKRVRQGAHLDTFLISLTKGEDKEHLLQLAGERLKRAARRLPALRREHTRWWHSFWRKSALVVPEGALESLYYAEMYKLGCNARAEARLPVSLQGIWSPDGRMPPWHGDYHTNLNVQYTYWPAYASNRLDCVKPLYDWGRRLLPAFKKECRRFYDCEGALVPCAVGPGGERVFGYETAEQWPGNGAWLAHLYWLHYLYSQDRDFLRTYALPFMREAMRLYMGILEERADGLLHIPLSASPEYHEDRPEAWGEDTACDLALIHLLGQALLQSVAILGLDDPDANRWRDILRRLAPYPSHATASSAEIRKNGACWPRQLFVMHNIPYAFSHRHMGHLMAIHPLGLLTVEDSPLARSIVEDSIRAVAAQGQGQWVGFSYAWASALASRARMPEMAVRLLREFGNLVTANTFHLNCDVRRSGACAYLEPGMTLESGFGVAGALMEMLLQSWSGKLRVFPAIPREWTNAVFHDLRAEGAFLVSARIQEGAVRWVEIRSDTEAVCHLENPFPDGPVTLKEMESGATTKLRGAVLTFRTRAGGRWLLYRKPQTGTSLRSLRLRDRETRPESFFGVKRRNSLPQFMFGE